nr:DNA-directed primase/polymerase protein [Ipomoea trifida]
MDDVDRLFECFKCGFSPPESAIRERKRGKRTAKPEDSAQKQSTEKIPQTTADADHSVENLGSSKAKRKYHSNGKQFCPLVFYGSPHGVPPKRPASLLRLLHEIRVDLSEQKKQSQEIWATFPKQVEAMKYAKQCINARVFSYQDHINGYRRFLVSTYEDFWKRYNSMNPKRRHHYEVIQEGLPCHLYFDLEFNKKANADKNGDEMVDLLIVAVFDTLLEKYSLEGSHDWIVELDSSTEDKFSRHLIIRLPKIAFKDNSHVGAFTAEVCSRIYSSSETDERFRKLFVSKDSKSVGIPGQLFVDNAVYSRNRCFRLALSSKAGKSSVLLPSGRFKCKSMSEDEMFMASLICNIDADCERLLVCKMDSDCVRTLHFNTEIAQSFQQMSITPQALEMNNFETDPSGTYLMGKSPFPAVDAFVEYIASIGSVPVDWVNYLRLRAALCICLGYAGPQSILPSDLWLIGQRGISLTGLLQLGHMVKKHVKALDSDKATSQNYKRQIISLIAPFPSSIPTLNNISGQEIYLATKPPHRTTKGK